MRKRFSNVNVHKKRSVKKKNSSDFVLTMVPLLRMSDESVFCRRETVLTVQRRDHELLS